MRSKTLTCAASAALLAVGLVGCAPESGANRTDGTLFEVGIPADFTFATTQGLTVVGAGDPAALGETLAEIRLADGSLVHRGPLVTPVQLSIPTAVQSLQVTLRSNTNEAVLDVPVVDGQAVVEID